MEKSEAVEGAADGEGEPAAEPVEGEKTGDEVQAESQEPPKDGEGEPASEDATQPKPESDLPQVRKHLDGGLNNLTKYFIVTHLSFFSM